MGARKTYIAECTNYGGSGCIENCVFSCGGLSITTGYSGRYPNVKGVTRDVREAGRMILCPDAWKDASKFFKSSKGQTVKITANAGEDFAVLSNEVGVECVIKTLQNPVQNVESTHKADSLRLFGNVCEIFFNGQNCPLTFISDDASMGLAMPCFDDSCSQFYEICESERHNPIELAKAARIDKKAVRVSSCRSAKENARKTPPTASCGKDMASAARGKRFNFEAVGVNVGDVLSFIDGTEVVAVDGNKVEFCGEIFTLSGFCKEFMPNDRRTKSNSYRGCNFFLDGVCLGKIFREVMEAAPDVPPVVEAIESVTLEIQGTDGIPEKGHISHEANNFEHKECEEKPHKGQTGRSDGKITLHPTVVPLIVRKRNTGRFWPLFGRVGAMEATAARRVRAKVLRRRAPTFVAGRVRPPPYYAHNEGRMNSFRFYNNFKISKE